MRRLIVQTLALSTYLPKTHLADDEKVQEAYEVLSNEDCRTRYDVWNSYQYRGPYMEARQRAPAGMRHWREDGNFRHRRWAQSPRGLCATLDALMKKARAETAARAHAEKCRRAEERSQAAIRRRQKESDRMARGRLQQQKETEQKYADLNQTMPQLRDAFQPQSAQQRADPAWGGTLEDITIKGDSKGGEEDALHFPLRKSARFCFRSINVQHTTHRQGQQLESMDRLLCGCAAGPVRSGIQNCDFCTTPRPVAYHCVECSASACSVCKKQFC